MSTLITFREQSFGTIVRTLVPAQVRAYKPSLILLSCGSMLVFSLLLGGGTRGGFLSDAILQLLAIPAFILSLSSLIGMSRAKQAVTDPVRLPLILCFAILLVPLIQLIPLPPWIWRNLPGREVVARTFELMGSEPLWMPISVLPNATWMSFLSLLPPLAIFLTTVQLAYRERRVLSLTVLVIGIMSVFLGLMQVAQGPSSPLRFFSYTNNSEAVGFFANRNHFAALVYVLLLFGGAWAIDVAFKAGSRRAVSISPLMLVTFTGSFLVLVTLITAASMARSRAGLALTMVALIGLFCIIYADHRNVSTSMPKRLVTGAIALAVILSAQFALYRILVRFATDSLEDGRFVIARNTIEAAQSFLPVGAGVGTFVPVYEFFEHPEDILLGNVYVNHAHNDFLELWLETGLFGAAVLGAFVIWFALRSRRVWRSLQVQAQNIDLALIRAATWVVALLMAHSFFDYPMRTGAIMALFAFACALLVEPFRANARPGMTGAISNNVSSQEPSQVLGVRSQPASYHELLVDEKSAASVDLTRQSGKRWGIDIDWPEEWANNKDPVKPE